MSLPVRENDTGAVFVQGLVDVEVRSGTEALDVLSAGTKNRITASTAMNAGSSRSHAVFTITLDQVVQSEVAEDDTSRITSRLTFVDLAGSERIKRTGAEGQRMKEGIQINSGLFNLGQVINGLADDVRIKNGTKAAHIPYRNSKLTHLLKVSVQVWTVRSFLVWGCHSTIVCCGRMRWEGTRRRFSWHACRRLSPMNPKPTRPSR